MTRTGFVSTLPAILCLTHFACGDDSLLGPGGSGPPYATKPDATMPATGPFQISAYSFVASLAPGGGSYGDIPATHSFSAVIDWQNGMLRTGANGGGVQVALVKSGSGWDMQTGFTFVLGHQEMPYLSYGKLQLRPAADGCTGEGPGSYTNLRGDIRYTREFTATLAGVVDREGPQLSFASSDQGHPLAFRGVLANELLPVGTTAELRDDRGGVLALRALPEQSSVGVSGFSQGDKALAFGATYNLAVLPAAVDLVGNPTGSLPTLATLSDPGLFVQDGFEGAMNAYMTGAVGIVDSTTLPVPTGSKALDIKPWTGSGVSACPMRYTVRLAVKSGAKVVRFSYLTYKPQTATSTSFSYTMTVAVPHGEVIRYYAPSATSRPLSYPWTGNLPGSGDFIFGDLAQMDLPLPAGVGDEVLFDIMRPCTEPPIQTSGVVIDDLRVE
jgi:hypothetical protein